MNIYDFLSPHIPRDHSRQSSSSDVLKEALASREALEVLDFGCGDGRSIDLFHKLSPRSKWTGVDIEDSVEVLSRRRTDGDFRSYDGRILPFAEASFDLVFSHQVLEHVRYPDLSVGEIARVLKPGGRFVGSTSQLEAYHSCSIFNFTVYGFARIIADAGMVLKCLRPGIDGITLIQRSMLGRPEEMRKYFGEESPGNRQIDENSAGRNHRIINFRKLMHCGQFVFIAEKK